MKKRVGVIGLGIMGGPIARNIASKGFPVSGYNRSDKKAWAQSAGIAICSSPKELAQNSDVMITMVSDHDAVREVALGSSGFLTSDVNGKIWLQMSTVNQKSTMAFADEALKRGMRFLDAPVTGSKKQVEEAQLIILAGGDKDVVNECKDIFMATSKAIVDAGDIGKGTLLKLSMNLAVVQMTTAICESVAFAKNLGVDPEKIFEVIGHSPALSCGYYQIKKKPLLEGDFSPAFSVANMLKDVRYMDEAAKAVRMGLPVTQAVRFILEAAMSEGLGSEDLTSIVKILGPRSKAAV